MTVATATVVTWVLWDLIEPAVALFFAAVMVSAWYGGFGPGFLASVLSAVTTEWLTGTPERPFDLSVSGCLRLGVFLLSALLISWLNGSRRSSESALRQIHAGLEQRVVERTRALVLSNERLQREIADRQHAEQEILDQQERLRQLASELCQAEERQLRQIATELHDGIGQLLATAEIRLNLLRDQLTDSTRPPSPAVGKDLDEIQRVIEEAVQRTRSLTVELNPPVLYQLGFEAAIRWLAAQAQERHGIRIDVAIDHGLPVNEELRLFLFRAVRELLVNMGKHSKARWGRIAAQCEDGETKVLVEDDGVGFDLAEVLAPHPAGPDAKHSFGLFNIRERLTYYRGRLEVDSEPGKGCRFTLVVPAGIGAPSAASATADRGVTTS